jgi:hypothetical protein
MNFDFGHYFSTGLISDIEFNLYDSVIKHTCYNDEWFASDKSQYAQPEEPLAIVNTFGYKPQYKDRLFIAKNSNVPRVKIKTLSDQYKIKTTTDITTATQIFISNEFLVKSHTGKSWNYGVKGTSFKNLLRYLKKENKLETLDYQNLLHHDPNFNIDNDEIPMDLIVERSTKEKLENLNEGLSSENKVIIGESSSYFYEIDHKLLEYVKDIYDSNIPIHGEEDLLVYLNGKDAITIEEDTFETLDEMFESSDTDNATLAMEIMANAEFRTSLAYILILFFKHHAKIDNSPTKKHVNFKSLIRLLPNCMVHDVLPVYLIDYLKQYKQFTPLNVEILVKALGDSLIRTSNPEVSGFTIKVISLDEKHLKDLNYNYKKIMQKDFIPVEKEEEKKEIINFDN